MHHVTSRRGLTARDPPSTRFIHPRPRDIVGEDGVVFTHGIHPPTGGQALAESFNLGSRQVRVQLGLRGRPFIRTIRAFEDPSEE